QFDWPGNVRELENEIERAMTLAGKEREISEEHLSEKTKTISEKGILIQKTDGTLKEVTEQIEERIVSETLQKTRGNRSQAARMLGLTRQGLLNKIARYNINL
ncbi:MAG: AAA family ATPase, partial [Deltaproteobacteria bacterium]|nr:AAA family ATPase [Deltaproteobacteria bacterium]